MYLLRFGALLAGVAAIIALTLGVDRIANPQPTPLAYAQPAPTPYLSGESRMTINGEIVLHDSSLFHKGDNPTVTYSPFRQDCIDGDHSGGVNVDEYKDTVIGDTCTGGIRTYRRMLVADGDDPPEYGLKRMYCGEPTPGNYTRCGQPGTGGANMGQYHWVFRNVNFNPVRVAGVQASSQGLETNGSLPVHIRMFVTDMSGHLRQGVSVNPNNGVVIHKGGTPVCELAGLPAAEQGVTVFWDSNVGKLAMMTPYPSCQIKYLAVEQP